MFVRRSRAVGAVTALFFLLSVPGASLAEEEGAVPGCDRICADAENDCFEACPDGDDEAECTQQCSENADRCFEACEADE